MAKFEMDTEFIRKLAKLLEETNLGEIEMAEGDRRIRVARPAVVAPAAIPVPVSALPVATTALGSAAPAAANDMSKHPGAVKSPMVGTVYLSPEPGKPVFVNVGDKVAAGQTLLIIEAMKTFNPIKAPKAGTVAQIMIDNAQPVEFGEPLMIVE
jgi:acetyl-CoA carboxylase biotin carboxyl carrier protein